MAKREQHNEVLISDNNNMVLIMNGVNKSVIDQIVVKALSLFKLTKLNHQV